MVTRYMERDPQLTVGQTMLCTYCGFMAAALAMGLVLGPMGMLMSFIVGTILSLVIVPVASMIWIVVRSLVGETFFTCLPFGAAVGCVVLLIFSGTYEFQPAIVGAGLGLFGGLVYWAVAQHLVRKPTTLVL